MMVNIEHGHTELGQIEGIEVAANVLKAADARSSGIASLIA